MISGKWSIIFFAVLYCVLLSSVWQIDCSRSNSNLPSRNRSTQDVGFLEAASDIYRQFTGTQQNNRNNNYNRQNSSTGSSVTDIIYDSVQGIYNYVTTPREREPLIPGMAPPPLPNRTIDRDPYENSYDPFPEFQPPYSRPSSSTRPSITPNQPNRSNLPNGPRREHPNIPNPNNAYARKFNKFHSSLPGPPDNGGTTYLDISVRRSHVLEDSYKKLMSSQDPKLLRAKLKVKFIGEAGLDVGGLTKEWFSVLSKAVFNPTLGLFIHCSDTYAMQINPGSAIGNKDHLKQFTFAGIVVGMAIYHGYVIDSVFILPFVKKILNQPIQLEDIKKSDPVFYNSMKQIKDNDPTTWMFKFSVEEEILGKTVKHDLKPGGSRISVNQSNKQEYIRLMIKWKFDTQVKTQMERFMKGLTTLIPIHLLNAFTASELATLISGVPSIDVNDWERNTDYIGYSASSSQIKWFWKMLKSMTNEKRAEVLQFVTGSSRAPASGFSHLVSGSREIKRFTIEKWGTVEKYPQAHTCFNKLDLPPYTSEKELKKKILDAIKNSSGFQIQ